MSFIAGPFIWTASAITLILGLLEIAVKLFALIDCIIRPARAFEAAGKLTKMLWLLMLGAAALWNVLFVGLTSIVNVAGLIAAIVYLVDVRPAVRVLGGGRGSGRSSGSSGGW
jgi:Protein of unknown function (DUF2516)